MIFFGKQRNELVQKFSLLAVFAACAFFLSASPRTSSAQVFSNGTKTKQQSPEPGCFNYVTCSFPVTLSSGWTTTCGPQNSPLAVEGAVASGGDEDGGTLCGGYKLWQLQKNGTMGWTVYYCGYDGPGNICPSN